MSKITISTFFTLFLCLSVFAQRQNLWKASSNFAAKTAIEQSKGIKKASFLELDEDAFLLMLQSGGLMTPRSTQKITVDLPVGAGKTETFELMRSEVMHPDLALKYPEIASFEGVSRDTRGKAVFISIYKKQIHLLVSGERTYYLDPIKGFSGVYVLYDRSDYPLQADNDFRCHVEDLGELVADEEPQGNVQYRNSTDARLRRYDLAVACTSEYTAYHGNTVAGALAAINTTVTRVNSVFRRELAIIFQLVSNNDRLIYRNNVNIDTPADPDPYDNYDGSQMLGINTSNINGIITSAAYDVGHVFSTGGGGIAAVGPCTTTKGNGVTGIVTPEFDPFDIDYVCHEIGHQFSAGHTQNNSCQRSAAAAYEPGSGSTIMGYAGICPPNIQGNSDPYFHSISIQQITTQVAGHSCDTETVITNSEPTIVTAVPDYTIPISTPFSLTASFTDADNDPLLYCWEQFNNGTTSGTMPPQSTSTDRPNFRSFSPTSSPTRVFPNLNDLINNVTPTWEVLPSVARTMNFRVTARDYNIAGGQTNQDNVVITVGTAGPFRVTSPNSSGVIWYVGESRTITWDVNLTNTATYSLNVNIRMSTDGGLTYPVTLLANTPNDGTQAITVPNNIGNRVRIRVEAAANVFFDISNFDLEIKSNKFEFTTTNSISSVCKPSNGSYTVNFTVAPGFSETVTFSAVGLPAGATASFSPTTRSTTGTVAVTISGISAVAVGNYNISVRGVSTTSDISIPLSLRVFDNNIGTISLASPADGAENRTNNLELSWGALTTAASYDVQIATSPDFATLFQSANVIGNTYTATSLTSGAVFYWRVRPVNPCLQGSFSEVRSFQVANDICRTYADEYFDGNAIWEEGTTNAVIAKVDVPDDISVTDVTFYMRAQHESLADIKMQLSGPTGIFAEIYNRDCTTGADFDVTFSDAGTVLTCGNVTPATNAGLEGIQQASQLLSKFDGSNGQGTWTLLATDRGGNTFGGTFNEFSVSLCGKLQINNNISLTNNLIPANFNQTTTVTNARLNATQPSSTTAQIIYRVVTLPSKGQLQRSGVPCTVGSTFSQADLNSGIITYQHTAADTNSDSFRFTVVGNSNTYVGAQTANLTICNLATTGNQNNVSCFGLSTGSATVNVTGGTAPYTYLWSPSGGTAATATNLAAGTYTVTATDANGCTIDRVFTITQPAAALALTAQSQINVACNAGTNGSATVNVATGGTGTYTYDWSPGTPTGDGTRTITGLASGTYTCTVTDSNGCTAFVNFTITQPAAALALTAQSQI
ncbi:reprolysin-like metallopeptidase, partial [Flavobacterium sp.]|uniref:reprolysin-like metallopeptidase n=1 Tax=Flavobacterium sp. TaxID=239 RepID=UPI003B9ABA19